jgi:hypothetical protein
MVAMTAIVAILNGSLWCGSVSLLWGSRRCSDVRRTYDNGPGNHGLVGGAVRNYWLRVPRSHHKNHGD